MSNKALDMPVPLLIACRNNDCKFSLADHHLLREVMKNTGFKKRTKVVSTGKKRSGDFLSARIPIASEPVTNVELLKTFKAEIFLKTRVKTQLLILHFLTEFRSDTQVITSNNNFTQTFIR